MTEKIPWKKYHQIPNKVTKDVRLQSFQYKMLHRIIATNDLQNKMKIKDSNLCTFCEQQPETLEHLFAECRYSNELWEEIQRYLAD